MSQFAAELCQLLIADTFGEPYALIFSYLLHHGRQPLAKISRNTRLSDRQVLSSLPVLIQQHLIYHITSVDDGVTYYDADWRGAYALVRPGKIMQMVEERLGKYAAKVMSGILKLGHVKISHLEDMSELVSPVEKDHSQTNGVNGVHAGDDNSGGIVRTEGEYEEANDGYQDFVAPELHPTLHQLAAYGYIMRVRDAHFHSPVDNWQAADRAAKASPDVQVLKGKKLQEAIEKARGALIEEWTDGSIYRGLHPSGPPRGIKRRLGTAQSDKPARKRVKLENDTGTDEDEDNDQVSEDEYVDDIVPMDGNLVIRVNYAKFDVSFRNRRLIDLAEQRTTTVTSHVYDALLARIESKTSSCRMQQEPVLEGEESERYSQAVPLHTILSDLGPQFELGGAIAGLGGAPLDGSDGPSVNGVTEDGDELDNEDDDDDGDGDGKSGQRGQNRMYQLEQHLSLLAQEPYFFTTRKMESGTVSWAVEFRHLARDLRHLELERLVEARFGSVGVRVVRVLAAKGRLDEKRLQEISLMASKDLRQILAQMEAAGFVDLQEVPRDAQRQPSRTIYLWFYDPDRACMMVLEDIYKAMSRCLQRLKIERHKLKFLLEKAERTDVRANMDRYLSAAELKTLKEWQEKEALLLGEVGRLDDVVAVLRDY